MTAVDFWHAVGWTCEECGRDNFVRRVIRQTSEAREVEGLGEVAKFVVEPIRVVVCAHCEARFETGET